LTASAGGCYRAAETAGDDEGAPEELGMMITLDLPPEVVQRLREVVAERDAEAVGRLLLDALTPALAALPQPQPPLSDEEYEQILAELDELTKDVPVPADPILTRESIYGDHP
jgi:hypothetical protein